MPKLKLGLISIRQTPKDPYTKNPTQLANNAINFNPLN